MRLRAFIFDIYNTLLEVGPPPSDAENRWAELCSSLRSGATRFTLAEFDDRCRKVIRREHASARAQGKAYPEVDWPSVSRRAFPGLEVFSPEALDDFLYVHAQLVRRVQLMAGAGESLQALGASAAMLGLCSNCQPYTLRELAAALAPAGLALTAFDPELCFFSFQAGFSKPDPMAFRQLGHILAGRGVTGEEILFVGDRLDNDIYPARAEGWRTWHLSATSSEGMGGDWNAFLKFIRAAGLLQAQA